MMLIKFVMYFILIKIKLLEYSLLSLLIEMEGVYTQHGGYCLYKIDHHIWKFTKCFSKLLQ
jgi:hypothetical protein